MSWMDSVELEAKARGVRLRDLIHPRDLAEYRRGETPTLRALQRLSEALGLAFVVEVDQDGSVSIRARGRRSGRRSSSVSR